MKKNENTVVQHAQSIAQGLFSASPLIKKRLAQIKAAQTEQGMPLSHVQVLALLEHRGSLSITEISRHFDIAKPNITPLIDRLMKAGMVERVRADDDRRVVRINLMEAGRQQLRSTRQALFEHVSDWAHALNGSDFSRLDNALSTVVEILDKL